MADDAGVPRETPPPPSTVEGVFGSRAALALRYAELLATEGVLRGLIGPREAPRLWERHLLNCAVVTELLPEGADVCDLGTGAGLPGVVLAIRRPDLRVTLVEPLLRRTTFLEEVVADLDLAHVTVVRGRAEDLHGVSAFSAVTSRALAPLPRLLDWSMPLVEAGGALLAMKGLSVGDELEGAREGLRRHGAGVVEILTVGTDVINPPTTVLRVESTRSPTLSLEVTPTVSSRGRPASPRGSRRRRRK